MKEEMKNPVSDEKEDEDGYTSYRVIRGGCWSNGPKFVRVSYRYDDDAPTRRNGYVGFRIVRNKK